MLLGLIASFVLGLYLAIRLIAALYQVLDLWYRIGTDYPRVIRGVVGSAVTIAVIARLLDAPFRLAFAAGLAAFLLSYVSVFGLWRLLVAFRQPADNARTGASTEKSAGSAGTRGN